MPNAKNQNGFIQDIFWHKDGEFKKILPRVLAILSFSCLCFSSVTAPGGHLG